MPGVPRTCSTSFAVPARAPRPSWFDGAKCALTQAFALDVLVLAVPVLRQLAEAGPAHPDCVSRVQPHPAGEVAITRPQQRARGVLRAGAERSDAYARCGVVLPPVAVPAAPHLVDPPLGDADAELRLVVNDRDLREVLRPPARAAQPAAEIGLLRVDEELLVEETDLLEGLTADEERGRHGPVDVAGLAASRLEDARPAEREQPKCGSRRRREPPRRSLRPPVGIDQPRAERGHPRIGLQVADHP